MVIYTKRGDKGETALYDKESRQNIRVPKASLKIGAIGAVDELNSSLGITIAVSKDSELARRLKEVQRNLLRIGSILAGSKLSFGKAQTKKLEKLLDKLEGSLPVLKNFILPGGSPAAAQLQYARALARRAERKVVALSKAEAVKSQILTYLNRLSDYLFMLARKVNHDSEIKEEVWKGKR
jgi:cob(I)alamin adenosyltransferase